MPCGASSGAEGAGQEKPPCTGLCIIEDTALRQNGETTTGVSTSPDTGRGPHNSLLNVILHDGPGLTREVEMRDTR